MSKNGIMSGANPTPRSRRVEQFTQSTHFGVGRYGIINNTHHSYVPCFNPLCSSSVPALPNVYKAEYTEWQKFCGHGCHTFVSLDAYCGHCGLTQTQLFMCCGHPHATSAPSCGRQCCARSARRAGAACSCPVGTRYAWRLTTWSTAADKSETAGPIAWKREPALDSAGQPWTAQGLEVGSLRDAFDPVANHA